MALGGGLGVPELGLVQVGGNAAAELVGTAEIELRVGIALHRRAAPAIDGALIVAALPGLDFRP